MARIFSFRSAALSMLAVFGLMAVSASAQTPDQVAGSQGSAAPQRVTITGYKTIYEIASQGCSRATVVVCKVLVRRVGDGRDNGLVVYAQSTGGTSTITAGAERYPASGVRLADSRQRFAPDKYWKTYSAGEESVIELEFASASAAAATGLAIAVTGPGSPETKIIRFGLQ